jgi:glycosyltransferase involved in cell wall biosynthesis
VIVHTFHGHVFHSYFGKFKTTIFKQVERFLAKRTSSIIAISEKQKQELASEHQIALASKIQVIPLGFDLLKFTSDQESKRKEFRAKYGIADHEICILIIGRLVPVKNHPLFLRAIASLQKKTTASAGGKRYCMPYFLQ